MDVNATALRPRKRQKRRSIRLFSLVTTSLGVGLAVFIGLSGAGATYSYLRDSGTAPGATVQAGTLTLQINDSSSAALGAFSPTPNTPVAKAFKVTNTGNAPTALTATIAASSTPAITTYSLARITNVANAAACTTGLTGTQAPLNGHSTAAPFDTVAVGASRWYCLEIGLSSGAPASVSGQSFAFTLTVNGAQSAS